MKKLVLSLTVAAFALGSVLQAGEGQQGDQDKAACCEKQKAACADKAACPAKDQAACAEKGACPVTGKVAKEKTAKEKTAKAKTVKSKDKAAKSGDQASAK
jgi:hypothetical protein